MLKINKKANKLAKARMKEISSRLRELDGKSFEVGYWNQNGIHETSGMTYSKLFAIHSFGSPSKGIPARPVLDISYMFIKKKLQVLTKKSLKKYFSNLNSKKPIVTASMVLETTASEFAENARDTFGDTFKLVSNTLSTIKFKGTDAPLVESGDLREHLGYKTSFASTITYS